MTTKPTYRPGEPVPDAGWYYAFDRYGAPTGAAVWLEACAPMPLVAVNGYGPLVYQATGA